MKSLQKRAAYSIIILLGICAVTWSFNSCNQNKNGDYKKKAKDSVKTWVLFTVPPQWGLGNGVSIEFIDRKTKDTTYFDTLDENTAKKTYKRDTSYWIYVSVYDIDSATQKPKLDSLKRPKIKATYYLQLPKDNIKHDFNNYKP